MSSLPPGVTDQMIDDHVNGPMCMCGHYWCDHYESDKDLDVDKLRRNGSDYDFAIEYDANGKIVHACDAVINVKTREQCGCTGFEEGWPEPDDDRYD